MLVRFHYKTNPLDIVWIDSSDVAVVESAKDGGTEISCRTGLQYTVMETPDVAAKRIRYGQVNYWEGANPDVQFDEVKS